VLYLQLLFSLHKRVSIVAPTSHPISPSSPPEQARFLFCSPPPHGSLHLLHAVQLLQNATLLSRLLVFDDSPEVLNFEIYLIGPVILVVKICYLKNQQKYSQHTHFLNQLVSINRVQKMNFKCTIIDIFTQMFVNKQFFELYIELLAIMI